MIRVVPESTIPAVLDRMLVLLPKRICWLIPQKLLAGLTVVIGLQERLTAYSYAAERNYPREVDRTNKLACIRTTPCDLAVDGSWVRGRLEGDGYNVVGNNGLRVQIVGD